MCGIAGFIGKAEDWERFKDCADKSLLHRGPDDGGFWFDKDMGVFLLHRRLAIIDLSPAGRQPMVSPSGRYVLIFNGEFYNHRELRRELESIRKINWRGHSDTEVFLNAVEIFGFETALKKSVGMFALALYDTEEKKLYLARDRIGEKPLYYSFHKGNFIFGSELKALRCHPKFEPEIDRMALSFFLKYGYIPAPYSIYKNTFKVLPGVYIVVDVRSLSLKEHIYWSIRNVRKRVFEHDEEAIEELLKLLKDAISNELIADVPVGVFLSGGIDSSTIASVAQSVSEKLIKTYTIGFYEKDYNEAEYAKKIAKHLGTDHTEMYLSPDEALEVISLLPKIWDEPFADPSQIPTYIISMLARRHVKVILSGDGGDELFGGYQRYTLVIRLWKYLRFIPLRSFLSDFILTHGYRILPGRFGAFDRVVKLSRVTRARDLKELYDYIISYWREIPSLVLGGEDVTIEKDLSDFDIKSLPEWMMYHDFLNYLPDDIFVKVDRASMAVSLETRAPFMDHRIVEFAFSLPIDYKLKSGRVGKWILRKVLEKFVPRKLFERPKKGFAVPIEYWLKGRLRSLAEDLIFSDKLKEYLNTDLVLKYWNEYTKKGFRWQNLLWAVLMFSAWLNENEK